MELLEFARGPGLTISGSIFAIGVVWRLLGIFRLGKKPDLSKPRSTATVAGGLRMILRKMSSRSQTTPIAKMLTEMVSPGPLANSSSSMHEPLRHFDAD